MFLLHRLIMYTFNGVSEMEVDHIDGNKANNRIENLRYCSHRDNSFWHFSRVKKELLTGVSFIGKGKNLKRPYQGRIQVNGRFKSLGCFETVEDAFIAYLLAKKKYG